jgi:hypothetical protein
MLLLLSAETDCWDWFVETDFWSELQILWAFNEYLYILKAFGFISGRYKQLIKDPFHDQKRFAATPWMQDESPITLQRRRCWWSTEFCAAFQRTLPVSDQNIGLIQLQTHYNMDANWNPFCCMMIPIIISWIECRKTVANSKSTATKTKIEETDSALH